MSIRINGYRIRTTNPQAFLDAVETVVAPVRNTLDVTLIADIIAELIDRHDRDRYTPKKTFLDDAVEEFTRRVNDGFPGQIFNHPHSFDLDYGYDPTTEPGPNQYLYFITHHQDNAYDTAIETIPGVEAYDYNTATDSYKDRGITDTEWEQRRHNWQFLINANRITDVMGRYTHRPEPTLDPNYALDLDVILAHLPTTISRATVIAKDVAVAENFAGATNMQARLREVLDVIHGPRVPELATEIEPTLRTITRTDLNTGTL